MALYQITRIERNERRAGTSAIVPGMTNLGTHKTCRVYFTPLEPGLSEMWLGLSPQQAIPAHMEHCVGMTVDVAGHAVNYEGKVWAVRHGAVQIHLTGPVRPPSRKLHHRVPISPPVAVEPTHELPTAELPPIAVPTPVPTEES